MKEFGPLILSTGDSSASPTFGRPAGDHRRDSQVSWLGADSRVSARSLRSRIVDHFGPEVPAIIDEEPERLREVRGLGQKRARDHRGLGGAASHQGRDGLSPEPGSPHRPRGAYLPTVWRRRSQNRAGAIRIGWRGISGASAFKTADAIGAELGIPPIRPIVSRLGLRHALTSAADDDGHVYLPREVLFETAAQPARLHQSTSSTRPCRA